MLPSDAGDDTALPGILRPPIFTTILSPRLIVDMVGLLDVDSRCKARRTSPRVGTPKS